MKRLLLSAAAAAALAVGGVSMSAAPASAEAAAFITGCTLVSGPPGASCDFIGVGPIGTYQLTVEGGRATLKITCNGVVVANPAATGTLVPGASEGSYNRSRIDTNACTAALTVTGAGAVATATFS